jgi:hypothetical protein
MPYAGIAAPLSSAASRGWAETDVDLVDPHFDPFDQGSEDHSLAGDGQLGPVLADVCGEREKTLLD